MSNSSRPNGEPAGPAPTRPVIVVEHEAGTGASLMLEPLGPTAQVVRPYLGEAFPDLADVAGVIVLGGTMGAWDDEVAPWLPATRTLIQDAVRTAVPTLGICLGGQLLAAACGGTAERGEPGLELGLVPVTPLAGVEDDPFFSQIQHAVNTAPATAAEDGAKPGDWLVRQYHYDAVTKLPADAELLVTGQRYAHQGFRVGPAAWGVQYHPEVSTALFTQWVETSLNSGELPPAAAEVLGSVQATADLQSLLAGVHARAFLAVVSGAEAAGRLR